MLYRTAAPAVLQQGFADAARLYRGEYPGYAECDTSFHDVQHALEVALAMARVMDGYQRTRRSAPLGRRQFAFGVLAALFHDCGYIRRRNDARHRNGAEYVNSHVARSVRFLREYLPRAGMAEFVPAVACVLQFTGYGKAAARVRAPRPVFRLLGTMLGSAQIIGKMSDRCYLEKCYRRLYPELALGGIVFASAEALVFEVPRFYSTAERRLNEDLDAVHLYVQQHFGGGHNLYLDAFGRNVRYAEVLAAGRDVRLLRRQLPQTLAAARA